MDADVTQFVRDFYGPHFFHVRSHAIGASILHVYVIQPIGESSRRLLVEETLGKKLTAFLEADIMHITLTDRKDTVRYQQG